MNQEKLKLFIDRMLLTLHESGTIARDMQGKVTAFIARTPQVRDVLMGAIIGKIKGGFAVNWSGNKLEWPTTITVPEILIGFANQEEIVRILK